MLRTLSSACMVFLALTVNAQYVDLGLDAQPHDSTEIDDLIDYGELLEFEGGYHVGDLAADFTLYDFEGNPINLYEELQGDKPVVLVSGSISCLRFRNSYDPNLNSQEYFSIRNFLDDYEQYFNWIYVYGIEAHPTDGNCPSNCPPTTSTDTTTLQHPDYHYRRWAVNTWLNSPEHEFNQNMFADNPDNAVYNTFFQRPFGVVVMNCDATVAMRGDWLHQWLVSNQQQLIEFRNGYAPCGQLLPSPDPEEEEEEEEGGEEEEEGNDEENNDEENEEGEDNSDGGNTDDDDPVDEENEDDPVDEEEEDEEEGDDDTEPLPYDGELSALYAEIDNSDESTLVRESFEDQIRLYPNPAVTLLRFEIPSQFLSEGLYFRVYGLTGRMLEELQITSQITEIDVRSFGQGMYLLEVFDAQGMRIVKRFQVH